jgi:predicted DNA-binding protein (UPF0251 family)
MSRCYIKGLIEQCERLQKEIQEATDDKLRDKLISLYEYKRKFYINVLNLFEKELSKLTPREQYALRLRDIENLPTSEVAEEIAMSYRHTQRIIAEAQEKITDSLVREFFFREK